MERISDRPFFRHRGSLAVSVVSEILEYMQAHDLHSAAVYLSLGNREEKTRNPVMAASVTHAGSVCAPAGEKRKLHTGMEQAAGIFSSRTAARQRRCVVLEHLF